MAEKGVLKDRLTYAMEVRGLRAVDIVERTGIPKGTISYYMTGKTEPKADRLYILAKVLNVNEAWLLGFDIPMDRPGENKKNDQLTKLIVRMRQDTKFYNIVEKLDQVPPEQLDNIAGLLAGLLK